MLNPLAILDAFAKPDRQPKDVIAVLFRPMRFFRFAFQQAQASLDDFFRSIGTASCVQFLRKPYCERDWQQQLPYVFRLLAVVNVLLPALNGQYKTA